jgi:phosphoglycolate phosphatase-like HAD superfamily hydrolase
MGVGGWVRDVDVRVTASSRVVAFDWNGTLVNDAERMRRCLAPVLAAYGLPVLDRAGFAARFTLPLDGFLAELGVPGHARSAALRGWEVGIAAEGAPLQPAAADVLERLRGMGARVGIVSAIGTDPLLADIARSGLHGAFDFTIAAAVSKRDALLGLLTGGREELTYVGDTEFDIAEAHAAGARAIAFSGGYRSRLALESAGPDHIVGRLAELPGLLQSAWGVSEVPFPEPR